MKLIFDNIIFSLQKAGGISVVWFELLKRALSDPDIDPYFIDIQNQNIFSKHMTISKERILNNTLEKIPITLQRYLNLNINKVDCKGIFHSSYYRIANNSNFINITTVHDFTYEYFRNGLAKFIHQSQKSNAINKSKRIICVSENTKSDLVRFYPNIKESQIRVIHNGVDNVYHLITKKNETELSQLVPFSSGEFILFVGDRKSNYKNFNMTVKACVNANLPLVMVGGELTTNETSFLTESLGSNKFKLLRGINNDQLNLIYNHAFCLLYPSLYEGFGIPILEAQRAGCPVISTNSSSIPEVAGKGAILIEKVTEYKIAEILNLLKRDSTIIAYLKDEGLKNSERFSWDKCYQQTKLLYKEVYEEYF